VAAPTATQADQVIRIEVAEETAIRSPSGKAIKQVFASRPGIAKIGLINPMDPTIIRVTGTAVGTVDVTIVDEQGTATRHTIRVLPDLGYIRDTLNRHFPRTNLAIEKVGEHTVVVSGEVEHSEQISGILRIAESIVGQGYVINNMRMAGVMQVQLEVCVAQVDRTEIRRMGFNWLQASRDQVSGSTIGGLIPNPITGPSVTSTDVPPGFLTSSKIAGGLGSQGLGTVNFVLGVFDDATSVFGFIQAIRQENLGKILSSPTLVTLSGRPASFTVGGEEPYGTAGATGISGGGGSGIQFKPFGTTVNFVPIVLGNGKIRIEVQPEVSSVREFIAQSSIIAPRLNTTRVETTVEMESGQTMVIGGLLENVQVGSTTKVPVLGDLPFVGMGFRTVSYSERETELLIIVTPYVVDPLDCAQRPTRLPGQETRTPTDFELFLEGILEAPRGQRPLCPDGKYRPAHYWAPAHCFPYGTPKPGHGGTGACGTDCSSCAPGVSGAYVNTGGSEVRVVHGPGATLRLEPVNPMTPMLVGPPQGVPQEANPLLPPQQQPVLPANYVPESKPAEADKAPEIAPASTDVQRPEPKDLIVPVPSEPVKPAEPARPMEQ
jgi:pilus assembly protein CpaC